MEIINLYNNEILPMYQELDIIYQEILKELMLPKECFNDNKQQKTIHSMRILEDGI